MDNDFEYLEYYFFFLYLSCIQPLLQSIHVVLQDLHLLFCLHLRKALIGKTSIPPVHDGQLQLLHWAGWMLSAAVIITAAQGISTCSTSSTPAGRLLLSNTEVLNTEQWCKKELMFILVLTRFLFHSALLALSIAALSMWRVPVPSTHSWRWKQKVSTRHSPFSDFLACYIFLNHCLQTKG